MKVKTMMTIAHGAKRAALIAISMMVCFEMNAQQPNPKAKAKQGSLTDLLHKHTYTGQYPLPELPQASPSLRNRASDASGEPFVFPDKVWFPGEWEEVKAIVVSPEYHLSCTVPVGDLIGTHSLSEGIPVDYYFQGASTSTKAANT